MFDTLFNTVFPTFTLIAIGLVYAKIRPEVSTRSISDLCLYAGIPAIILNDMVGMDFGSLRPGPVIVAGVMAVLLPGIIGLAWLKLGRIGHPGLLLPISFLNAANLPIPIVRLQWGAEGVAIAVILYTVNAMLVYTLGITIAAKDEKLKEVFKLPYVYALSVVFIMNALNWRFPKPIKTFLSMSGDMAYPLMLVVMGIVLGRASNNSKKGDGIIKIAIPAVIIRLFVGMITALAVVLLFRLTDVTKAVVIFYGIMPGAIVTTLFAEKFQRDSELVAYTVFIGTVISLIFIPILLILLS